MVYRLPLLRIFFGAIVLVVNALSKCSIHLFLALLMGALMTGVAACMPQHNIIPSINNGFGEMDGIMIMGSNMG